MQGFLSVFEIIQPRFILNVAAGVCSLTQTLSLNYKPHPPPQKKIQECSCEHTVVTSLFYL